MYFYILHYFVSQILQDIFFQYLVNFIFIIFLFLDHCVLNCNMITLKWRNFFLILCNYIPWVLHQNPRRVNEMFRQLIVVLRTQKSDSFHIFHMDNNGKRKNLTTLQLHSTNHLETYMRQKMKYSLLDNAPLGVLSKKE